VVSFKEPFTPQQPPQPITVAKLKRIGIMHLRPPPPSNPNQPDHWVNTWGIRGTQLAVMEVPFMLAQAALDFTPNTNKLFNGASHLLTNFYPTATSFKKLRLAPLRVQRCGQSAHPPKGSCFPPFLWRMVLVSHTSLSSSPCGVCRTYRSTSTPSTHRSGHPQTTRSATVTTSRH
jgi:hypothetical protein